MFDVTLFITRTRDAYGQSIIEVMFDVAPQNLNEMPYVDRPINTKSPLQPECETDNENVGFPFHTLTAINMEFY